MTAVPLADYSVPPDNRMLYRPEDVARLLSVTRTRVYDLMRSGELASVKLGRSRRVTAQALTEFVAALEYPVGPDEALR